MALFNCPECGARVSDRASNCPSCGYPITRQNSSLQPDSTIYAPGLVSPSVVSISKSRGVYIILGLLFGAFGFHNFYIGRNFAGGIKVGLFILALVIDASTGFVTAFSVILLVIFALWALIEVVVVKNDSRGNALL